MSEPRSFVLQTVRHAPSVNTAARNIAGRLDVPLSEDGRRWAREFASQRGLLRADAVVVSPYKRTIETACIVTGLEEEELTHSDLCVERDYGELQGLCWLSPDLCRGVSRACVDPRSSIPPGAYGRIPQQIVHSARN